MEFGATSEITAYTCHPHPTHPEAIEAAVTVMDKPVHIGGDTIDAREVDRALSHAGRCRCFS